LQGNPDILLNRILNNYANKNCTISRIDGIKLDFENYWIHLRKSNTEPIIRIITEAKNKIEAEKNQKEFMDSLK
jgi:phosphomannomutase